VSFTACDQYGAQADLFAQAILADGLVPTALDDAVANLRAIDALVRSAASGTWERP
jgi:predicted dehydrogenase